MIVSCCEWKRSVIAQDIRIIIQCLYIKYCISVLFTFLFLNLIKFLKKSIAYCCSYYYYTHLCITYTFLYMHYEWIAKCKEVIISHHIWYMVSVLFTPPIICWQRSNEDQIRWQHVRHKDLQPLWASSSIALGPIGRTCHIYGHINLLLSEVNMKQEMPLNNECMLSLVYPYPHPHPVTHAHVRSLSLNPILVSSLSNSALTSDSERNNINYVGNSTTHSCTSLSWWWPQIQ